MASITASLPGRIQVTGTLVEGQGIQYTITLANGDTAGPYTGDQLIDLGSTKMLMPPPGEFQLTYGNKVVASSFNPDDLQYGGSLIPNLMQMQSYIEKNLAVEPEPAPTDPPPPPPDPDPAKQQTPDSGPGTEPPQTEPDPRPQQNPASGSDPYLMKTGFTTTSTGPATPPPSDTENDPPIKGVNGSVYATRAQATSQDQANAQAQGDWRVRLQLAPSAKYLYKSPNPGILKPLIDTAGVLFPYTPSIQVTYSASYDPYDLIHSNYRSFQYKNSAVDNIQITCDFTAQDTDEAEYVLAVIHFFRSVTKMFYGQDNDPPNGVPPPLVYLTGMGAFQFDRHPMAIIGFTYALPTDVDYIQAGSSVTVAGQNAGITGGPTTPRYGTAIGPGGNSPKASFSNTPTGSVEPTYVPTKIQLTISAIPIISRDDISNNFSLENYANGSLLRGRTNKSGTGMW